MFCWQLLFIKLSQFFAITLNILVVYMNESNIECTLIVELGFHVVKHRDGRGGWHIRIVYVINASGKSWLSPQRDFHSYSL